MFKFILSLFLLSFSLVFAENIVLPKNQILVTDKGIMFEMNDMLFEASGITYIGNGMYEVANYGHCGRCGWPLSKTGKCTNQNCNQYGPRERD